DAERNVVKGLSDGLMKILSKMGISAVQSYVGAQILEAIGLGDDEIEASFPGTPSRLGGIGLDTSAAETLARHRDGFAGGKPGLLPPGDDFQWRKDGEAHMFNPATIHMLQIACRNGDEELYRRYSELLDRERGKTGTLR